MTASGSPRPPGMFLRYSGMSEISPGVPCASSSTAVWPCSYMGLFPGVFAHEADHVNYVVYRGPGNDAVPQVEDVAWTSCRLSEDSAHALAQQLGRSEQSDRVEVALHGAC